jgi:hypothetical protein
MEGAGPGGSGTVLERWHSTASIQRAAERVVSRGHSGRGFKLVGGSGGSRHGDAEEIAAERRSKAETASDRAASAVGEGEGLGGRAVERRRPVAAR